MKFPLNDHLLLVRKIPYLRTIQERRLTPVSNAVSYLRERCKAARMSLAMRKFRRQVGSGKILAVTERGKMDGEGLAWML